MFQRRPVFYAEDSTTGKQESLQTKDRGEARRLLAAKNEAHVQPALNLHIARVYLSATDPQMRTRTWQHVMDAMALTRHGDTLYRWKNATKDEAFDSIRHLPLLEARAEHLLHAISQGTVSTNVFLRRMHNFAVDMSWLAWPVIPKRLWPAIQFREKRAVTAAEHERIVVSEHNRERRAFYELCWHLGDAQSDIANLHAEDVDWEAHTVGFFRKKTKSVSLIHLDGVVEKILRALPMTGPLFPKFRKLNTGHRATKFTFMPTGERQRRHASQLSVCVGRTRENVWLPRTFRPASPRAQQQGGASLLRKEGAGDPTFIGQLRARVCRESCEVEAGCGVRTKTQVIAHGRDWVKIPMQCEENVAATPPAKAPMFSIRCARISVP